MQLQPLGSLGYTMDVKKMDGQQFNRLRVVFTKF